MYFKMTVLVTIYQHFLLLVNVKSIVAICSYSLFVAIGDLNTGML